MEKKKMVGSGIGRNYDKIEKEKFGSEILKTRVGPFFFFGRGK